MALKMSFRVILVMFFIATFLNIAKHFMRFNDYPKGNTILLLDITTNDSFVRSRHEITDGFDWDDLITCTENVSDRVAIMQDDSDNVTRVKLDLCPDVPPGLGPVGTGEAMINVSAVQSKYAELKPGGVYKGRKCKARQSVAIIIPYSGLKKFLHPFLYFMHPFLMKQQLEYQVFVVEYSDKSAPFNRGHLFNIGVSEALKLSSKSWSCLVLHEANLLPLDMRNLYRCSWYPRQLVAAFEETEKTDFEYKTRGGAIALTPEQYMKINGFTNTFMERDAFYDNFYKRILLANYTLEKSDESIGMYRIMKYIPWNTTDDTDYVATYASEPFHANGYSNLSYKLSNLQFVYFYTRVNVTVPASVHMNQDTIKSNNIMEFR